MKISASLSILVFLPALTLAVTVINDTQTFKPCFMGSTECPENQQCFQYFCYPLKGATTPLKSCTKNSHCDGYRSRTDNTEKCYKNGKGVCVPSEDYETCEAHEECKDRGGKCCGERCCNTEYFDALQKTACPKEDEDCEVRYCLILNRITNSSVLLLCVVRFHVNKTLSASTHQV